MAYRSYLSIECPDQNCRKQLKQANSARNFSKPALSVSLSLIKEIIHSDQRILEVGSGNLRNSLFLLKSIKSIKIYSYDLNETINRFSSQYNYFYHLGGRVVRTLFTKYRYDVVICTFTLETICPLAKRECLLKSMKDLLKKDGKLIASFRGYTGVRGSRYTNCSHGEGLITPLNTFIKPYSVKEVKDLFSTCGYDSIYFLQNYKVNKPQNIHLIAT